MDPERVTVTSDTEWESSVGYSRAVRVGPHVHVSGTTATDENGDVVGVGDPYAQAHRAFEIAVDALGEAGADVDDVVRMRTFVTDVDDWEAIGEAHREFFGDVRPAATMVQVERLIDPEHLVEVEVEAIATADDGPVDADPST
ncbi:RidA family protein [Halovivax sp.]|uniref:RidA family protein n=1 Tax=Halovivax sp. TaxID=1935978 RepID=UPI0025BE0490|nr:RidA family protein [Halovivax sp.]